MVTTMVKILSSVLTINLGWIPSSGTPDLIIA